MESARDRSFRGANLDPSPSMACHVGYNQNEGLLPVQLLAPWPILHYDLKLVINPYDLIRYVTKRLF